MSGLSLATALSVMSMLEESEMKPDDIPQDVWDSAINELHTDWDDPALAMARVIMTVKEKERREVKAFVDQIYDLLRADQMHSGALSFLPAGGSECERLVLQALQAIDDIRKRGEA